MFVQIKDFPGYLINDSGVVVSLKSGVWREMRTQHNKAGYAQVGLVVGKKAITKAIHRLVMSTFSEDSSLYINHKNGIKNDNRLDNLEYCTQAENVHHAISTGLTNQAGTKGPNSKLTDEDVLAIRSSNETLAVLSARYGVAISQMSKAKRGLTYKTVEVPAYV